MTKLNNNNWNAGVNVFAQTRIMVQRIDDGWFAKVDCEKFRTSIISGPWETQQKAEIGLLNAFDAFAENTHWNHQHDE